MIRYAGYDPSEAPLKSDDLVARQALAMQNCQIDVDRAIVLKRDGMTWQQVGVVLAKKACRATPYQGQSVSGAVSRCGLTHETRRP